MKTALYIMNSTLLRLIKNTISQSLFFTLWSVRFASLYNATLFLLISMIFLHFSEISCSSSDHNPTRASFTVNCQKNAHTDYV